MSFAYHKVMHPRGGTMIIGHATKVKSYEGKTHLVTIHSAKIAQHTSRMSRHKNMIMNEVLKS